MVFGGEGRETEFSQRAEGGGKRKKKGGVGGGGGGGGENLFSREGKKKGGAGYLSLNLFRVSGKEGREKKEDCAVLQRKKKGLLRFHMHGRGERRT